MKVIIELMDGTLLKMKTNDKLLYVVGERIDKDGGLEVDGVWYLKHTVRLIRINEM
ncbi:hypothetical protein [Paenibacillus macquariensis]|uniref:Uncharacterized protein n=1 Tax=Paenibacillus macquariensis TaxID=948756 RepID=A0ABY1K1B8_9BACL|nr:hypothetical protein [Paenibacillus macquariensis]MEC0091791.1 hypothetical protein [Paenibacillus macquariensis]SIR11902.1 hypothetical protein SAMN05421578_107124 [Paenibacillus macquariensis]